MRSSALVLFVCAGLLLSGGAILGGSTAWSLLRMSYYFWTTDLGVELGTSVLLVAGALLSLPICWLATVVPYYNKSSMLVATLMSLTMASMLMLSLGVSAMAGLSRSLREPAALNASMQRALTHVGFDPSVRGSFSAMQIELKCCGVQSSSDWYQYRRSLPHACCGRMWDKNRSGQCNMPVFTAGCLRPALAELRNFANSITVLASAIIIVMAVTLFASAYTLVSDVLDAAEPRLKLPQLQIACLLRPQSLLQPRVTPSPCALAPIAPPASQV